MKLSDAGGIISAGLEMARDIHGDPPLVVVPTLDLAQIASNVIVAPTVLKSATLAHPVDHRVDESVMLFPAEITRLHAAVTNGWLPATKSALVLESGQWRSTTLVQRQPHPQTTTHWNEARVTTRARKRLMSPAHSMESAWRRRLQPLVDNREKAILSVLVEPGEFPYRMSHVVKGRVLLAIGNLSSGGAERQVVITGEGLRKRGVNDLHILVEHLYDSPDNSFYLEKARQAAVAVHGIQSSHAGTDAWAFQHADFRNILTDDIISRIMDASKEIYAIAPELVHISLDWTNITVGIAAVLAGVPQIVLAGRNLGPAHFDFFHWFMYPCYRALLQCKGVHLLNNSNAGRKDYARWLRIDRERIHVLRNGIRSQEFPVVDNPSRQAARDNLGLPASAKVVTGIFRVSHEKRPLLWVETAARIQRAIPDAQFLLCGIGPLTAATQARAQAVGLGKSIRFLGARKDIQTIIAASDIVMQVSLQEGTPNALIEAQASGIPVVTTPAFGAAEAVEDGVTGTVVRGSSARRLARAAVAILQDDTYRERVRTAGPLFIERTFGFDRLALETIKLYGRTGANWAAAHLSIDERYTVHVTVQSAEKDGRFGWIAVLPELAEFADSEESPRGSRLVVLENGRRLGPAHTMHDIVRAKGSGAYSHYGSQLFFSTSDGSNPNVNGKSYVAALTRFEWDVGPPLAIIQRNAVDHDHSGDVVVCRA